MSKNENICIGVLTSGGDAPGMNAAVRAVVRKAILEKVKVFVIKEGYHGLVNHKGGQIATKYIVEYTWEDVGGILNLGGTKIGTARCAKFNSPGGRLDAARNLVKKGINRLIVIGGDGSLAGANDLYDMWPKLMDTLKQEGLKEAQNSPKLAVVGIVASIDNDMCDMEITLGANTALHRISEAIDIISSTAASHQRIFVVETMGRQCGYLALMGSLITGADWIIIPEDPPNGKKWEKMINRLREAKEKGQKRSIIVVLAEGTKDCYNVIPSDPPSPETTTQDQVISSVDVAKALRVGLRNKSSQSVPDVRITILGHIQRGGSPSFFDRMLGTLLGYAAVKKIFEDDIFDEPCIVTGLEGKSLEDIKTLPLKSTVLKNQQISKDIEACNFKEAMKVREECFSDTYVIAKNLMKPENEMGSLSEGVPCFAVLHSGAPAPGMNAAVRAAVRLSLQSGYKMIGVKRGFEGLINNDIEELSWSDVNGWASKGGTELGTTRTLPIKSRDFTKIKEVIKTRNIKGLLIIGGWSGYQGALDLSEYHEMFKIPIICMPATISNSLPNTDYCIGSDTALNNIVDAVDKIKESAVASTRCFLVEVMGRYCGYLALMSGLATGAERIYMDESNLTLKDIQKDLSCLKKEFKDSKRKLALIMCNEKAHDSYDTNFITKIFGAENQSRFDARQAILGHLQQGGKPSPFDRILATRLAKGCIDFLVNMDEKSTYKHAFIGIKGDQISEPVSIRDLSQYEDSGKIRAKNPWWINLRSIASELAVRKS